MSFDRSFYLTVPSLQQQTQRVWAIGRLWREGALDRIAGLRALDTIYTTSDNPALRRLCRTIAGEIAPALKAPPPVAEATVEIFAR